MARLANSAARSSSFTSVVADGRFPYEPLSELGVESVRNNLQRGLPLEREVTREITVPIPPAPRRWSMR